MSFLENDDRFECCMQILLVKNCESYVIHPVVRQLSPQSDGTFNRGANHSGRSFARTNESLEEHVFSPKIVNVYSLAPPVLKFSESLITFMKARNNTFFYHLPVDTQLKILKRIKSTSLERISFHELAREFSSISSSKLAGWLSAMKHKVHKVSTLENVPKAKVDLLNEEFNLSETLSDDRLLLLSHMLAIDDLVIQKFFVTKQNMKNERAVRPSLLHEKPNQNDTTASTNKLLPFVRLVRCSVTPGKVTDFIQEHERQLPHLRIPLRSTNYSVEKSRKRIFTQEQLTILKNKYSQLDYLDKEEADRVADQFGGNVTGLNILTWIRKHHYRKKLKERESSVAEGIESCSSCCRGKSGPLSLSTQNFLFEEYKKSSVLTLKRRSTLERNLKISSANISTFFSKMSALLRGKTKNDVIKLLTPYSQIFLSKIAAEYHQNRFISPIKMQKLAKKWKTSRFIIRDWFNTARLYEVLCGHQFTPSTKLLSASSTPSRVHRSECLNSSELVSVHQAILLWKEYEKDPNITQERIRDLAQQLCLSVNCIRRWFEINLSVSAHNDRNQKTAVLKPIVPKKPSRTYEPSLLEILFNAFKQLSCNSLSPSVQLKAASNLSSKQIHKWFYRTRQKLCSVAAEELIFQSEYRNKNLSKDQVEILEMEFYRHPYNTQETVDKLALQLQVSKNTIKTWFMNRRNYELIVSAMPELVENWKSKSHCELKDKLGKDVENSDYQKYDSFENNPKKLEDVEKRIYQREDAASNDSNENYSISFDDICNLLSAPKAEDKWLPMNHDPQPHTKTSPLCKIDVIAPKKQDDDFVPLTESLQNNSVESCIDNLETRFPRSMSVETGSEISDFDQLCSFNVNKYLNSEMKSISSEKYVGVCESVPFTFEEPRINISATIDEPPDGSKPFSDTLNSSFEHLKIVAHDYDIESNETLHQCQSIESPISLKPVEFDSVRLSMEPRKNKLLLSDVQREKLLQEYEKSPFLFAPKAQMLASDLNLSVKQIKLWFRKKRRKASKLMKSEKLTDEKYISAQPNQILSPFQLFVLEREFHVNSKLTEKRLNHLCQKLHTAEGPIIAWFIERIKKTDTKV